MKSTRRGFFGLIASIAAMPSAALAAATLPGIRTQYHRLSADRDDPGEIRLGILRAEGYKPVVYLDGVEQKHAITADSREGWVKRTITSPSGKLVLSGDQSEILNETVHGRVEIRAVRSKTVSIVSRGESILGQNNPLLENIGSHVGINGRLKRWRRNA